MSKHNELPEVNHYIKEHKLTPCDTEKECGGLYDGDDDITYLVVYKDNTYISYNSHYIAWFHSNISNDNLVICRGKIHE